jgi:hypothetical protein
MSRREFEKGTIGPGRQTRRVLAGGEGIVDVTRVYVDPYGSTLRAPRRQISDFAASWLRTDVVDCTMS